MKTIFTLIAITLTVVVSAQSPLSNDTNRNNIINKETEEVFEDLIDQAGKFITSLPARISEKYKKNQFEKENKNRCLDTLVCDLSEHAQKFAVAAHRSKVKRIAIVAYTDSINHLGLIMADKFSTALGKTINDTLIVLVDRNYIDKIIKEKQLDDDGYIEPGTAIELGHLLGADAIITGTVRVSNNMIFVNSRLINAKTGVLITSDDATLKLRESYTASQRANYAGALQNGGNSTSLNSNEYQMNEKLPDHYTAKNLGLLKVKNTLNKNIAFHIYGNYERHITVPANGEQNFYELPAGRYRYYVCDEGKEWQMHFKDGELFIETGKGLAHVVN